MDADLRQVLGDAVGDRHNELCGELNTLRTRRALADARIAGIIAELAELEQHRSTTDLADDDEWIPSADGAPEAN